MSEERVDFSYGFALRGERSVERGLESIMERFARTGSFADLASASLEKFGRIFEVGLPLAIGAAALGVMTEKLYEVGNESLKTREKIDRMTSEPLNELDTSAIESQLSQIGDELDELGTPHGKKFGENFKDGVREGLSKVGWDLDAFMANNVPGAAAFMNFVDQKPGEFSNNMPGWDVHNGNIPKLDAQAAAGFKDIRAQDAREISMLKFHADTEWTNANLDPTQPGDKLAALYNRQASVSNDLQYAKIDQSSGDAANKKQSALIDADIAASKTLTKDEIELGLKLQKRDTEERKKVLDLDLQYNSIQGEINAYTRSQAEFKKGEVVASHGRSIGGGGGMYSHMPGGSADVPHYTGLHGFGAGPGGKGGHDTGSINDNLLRNFTDAVKAHTDVVLKATGGSLQSTSLN